jgi:hypothetical protein
VGKSTRPKARLRQHCKDIGETTDKKKWIKRLRELGLNPLMQIVAEYNSEAEGRLKESELVKKHIETVYNIHMPGKGEKDVKVYKKAKNETI